jgi:hypothetical protein
LQAHQPFDLVQTTVRPIGEQITPHPAPTIGAVAAMKLAFTLPPSSSSLRGLALGERFSQAWKPDRDTPAYRIAMPPARSPGASR